MADKYDLPGMLPGGRYLLDSANEYNKTKKQYGTASAVGGAARAVTALPLAVADDIISHSVRPAWDAAAQGLKTFVTGDPSPIGESPRTDNAVNTAAATEEQSRPAYPTAYRTGYESRGADETRSVPVPVRAQAQQPAGYSFPSITFNQPPSAVAAGAAGIGSSGLGMISPAMEAQLSSLESEARPLLSSAGIVDRLRGRQLLRARDRLLSGAAGLASVRTQGVNAETGRIGAEASMLGAQTGAFRASNEVPLALLNSATQRYGTDVNAAERRYATDMGFLPNMPEVVRGELMYGAARRGDTAEVERAALLGRYPPLERNLNMQQTMDGRFVYAAPGDARPSVFDPNKDNADRQRRRDALVDVVK